MKLLPDSLQSTQFRNYFAGNMLSYHGVQIFILAESLIVHELNEAPEALGLLGLYASIPILVFNLFGGALADRFSKKLILSVVQICMATVYFFFAYLYSTDYIQDWHVYIIAAIIRRILLFNFFTGGGGLPEFVGVCRNFTVTTQIQRYLPLF